MMTDYTTGLLWTGNDDRLSARRSSRPAAERGWPVSELSEAPVFISGLVRHDQSLDHDQCATGLATR